MVNAYILLGANLGNKLATFIRAKEQVANRVGRIVRQSGVYESEAWGFVANEPFYNQVLEVETALAPSALLSELLTIEGNLGRVRSSSVEYQSRPIDIDILLYGDQQVSLPTLTIPHPRMHERMFTLVPLSELIPDYIHPTLKKPVRVLLKECPDKGEVRRVESA